MLSLSLSLSPLLSKRRRQMTVEQIEIVRHLGENEWASFKNNSREKQRDRQTDMDIESIQSECCHLGNSACVCVQIELSKAL